MAVKNEWGGHQSGEKAAWLLQTLVEHFDERGRKVDADELEDILLQVMANEFNAMLEDGSERIVAVQIMRLFEQSVRGETTFLEQLRSRPVKQSQFQVQAADPDCESSDTEDSENEEMST